MKQIWAVSIFTGFYLMAAFAAAILMGNKEFMFYLAATPFLIAGVALIHIRVKLPISLLWALSGLGLVHCLGGLITLPANLPTEGKHLLYNFWIIPGKFKYDQAVHTYGNAVATWLCWNLLRYSIALVVKKDIADIPARPVFLIICFLAGVGVGALNEMLEFGATQTVPGDHNVGGYVNTGWDLVANTLGGLITIFFIWLKRRDGRLPAVAKCTGGKK